MNAPIFEVDAKIRAIKELAFDVALLAERDEKFAATAEGAVLQDVPEDGTSSDFEHGLRTNFGFFGKAGAEATSADEDQDLEVCGRGREEAWSRAAMAKD